MRALKALAGLGSGLINIVIAMTIIPGVLIGMYLLEPHRPLPPVLANLPYDVLMASNTLDQRLQVLVRNDVTVVKLVAYLEAHGFYVDGRRNTGTFTRRNMSCVESFTIAWNATHDVVNEARSRIGKDCSSF